MIAVQFGEVGGLVWGWSWACRPLRLLATASSRRQSCFFDEFVNSANEAMFCAWWVIYSLQAGRSQKKRYVSRILNAIKYVTHCNTFVFHFFYFYILPQPWTSCRLTSVHSIYQKRCLLSNFLSSLATWCQLVFVCSDLCISHKDNNVMSPNRMPTIADSLNYLKDTSVIGLCTGLKCWKMSIINSKHKTEQS